MGESVALRRSNPQDPPVLSREESVTEPEDPLVGDPDGLDLYASEDETSFIEGETSSATQGSGPGSLSQEATPAAPVAMDTARPGVSKPAPQESMIPPSTATPVQESSTGSKKLPDELLFPAMGSIPLPLEPEKVALILQNLEGLVDFKPTNVSADRTLPVSRRRLLTGSGEEAKPSTPEYAIDESIAGRLGHWARCPSKDLASFNKEFNKVTRVSPGDYESFIKTPQIPDTVWELLKQPSSGAPAATGLLPKGIRLSNPAAQRREESLRAVDRALRIGVKVQALAVWTAEGLNTLLSPAPYPQRYESGQRSCSGACPA